MSKETVRIKFISAGFKAILNGEGVYGLVESTTENIQTKANANLQEESEGYSAHVWQGGYGGGRWVGNVSTTDRASMVAESEDKALSRAVTG